MAIAFAVTTLYLLQHYCSRVEVILGQVRAALGGTLDQADFEAVVAVTGALLPALAAALSSIRSHGEYAQIAARYDGARHYLETIEGQITVRLPNRRQDYAPPPLRSVWLA